MLNVCMLSELYCVIMLSVGIQNAVIQNVVAPSREASIFIVGDSCFYVENEGRQSKVTLGSKL
jgi:hypothetical protein